MSKLLPIILALIGLAAGTGAGLFLRPAELAESHAPEAHPDDTDDAKVDADDTHSAASQETEEGQSGDSVFVKLNNQFIIPVVNNEEISALVVISLSLEVDPGQQELVFLNEPKITDAFLQVMFNHANHGGFDGVYTQSTKLRYLRNALLEVANLQLGDIVRSVLVTNIIRQDS